MTHADETRALASTRRKRARRASKIAPANGSICAEVFFERLAFEYPYEQEQPSVFHSRMPPCIDLNSYALRLVSHCACSPACHLAARRYAEALARVIGVDPLSSHRILAISTLLAVKFLEDEVFPMSWYAKIFGLGRRELCRLELDSLRLLQWNLSGPLQPWQ